MSEQAKKDIYREPLKQGIEVVEEEKKKEMPELGIEKERPVEKKVEEIEGRGRVTPPVQVEEVEKIIPEHKEELKTKPRQEQVKALCKIAFDKGLAEAIKTAKALDNAYVLDEFHDTLVDELYKELVEKGRLKKE